MCRLWVVAVVLLALTPQALAVVGPAPTREVANKCLTLAYKAYPWRRPGSVRGTPDRYMFFKDCVAKEGNVELQQTATEPAAKPVQ